MKNNNEEEISQNTQDNEQRGENIEKELEEEIDSADKMLNEVAELKDKLLRLYSEFENYKKRTFKERVELSKTAGVEMIIALLPLLDDFDRALKSIDNTTDINSLKDGVILIQSKFKNILSQKGLEEMTSTGTVFNTDLHDAITNATAPSEEMKGKVMDEVEKGYLLNGKVIRHAKVVVGQ